MTVRLGGNSSRYGNSLARAPSISTATTRPALRTSLRVNTPRPGPTSRTTVSRVRSAAATMRSSIRPSARKCCPKDFLGLGPDRGSGTSPLDRGEPPATLGSTVSGLETAHLPLTTTIERAPGCDSGQALPRHPQEPAYRCSFRPGGVHKSAPRGTQPSISTARHIGPMEPPGGGIQPRYSGLRVQGTASSPSSAASITW